MVKKPISIVFFTAAGALLSLLIALCLGSYPLHLSQIWHSLVYASNDTPMQIILQLRLPRILTAACCGGLLAVAGALLQVMLRNPLADPYVLGISGGAVFFNLLACVLGLGVLGNALGALLGAGLAMLTLYGLLAWQRSWSAEVILLMGIVLASGWGALTSLVLSLASSDQLPGMVFWLMGDLSQARWPWVGAACLLVSAVGIWRLCPELDLLRLGRLQAASLGVDTGKLYRQLLCLSAILTTGSVISAGNIGFIGLIVPHFMRRWVGSTHRVLLPAAFFAGSALLVVADTVARTVIAPLQLPVGVVTALIGVPCFLSILVRAHYRGVTG